jgi:hypothetical protein
MFQVRITQQLLLAANRQKNIEMTSNIWVRFHSLFIAVDGGWKAQQLLDIAAFAWIPPFIRLYIDGRSQC